MAQCYLQLGPEASRWAQLAGVATIATDENRLLIAFCDGTAAEIAGAQLYDDAPARFDPVSGQRFGAAVCPDPSVALEEVRAESAGIEVVFTDGSAVGISFAVLAKLGRPAGPAALLRPWSPGQKLKSCQAADFFVSAHTRRSALAAVARDGACLLRGLACDAGALERVVAAFGFIRETNYGRAFDVRISQEAGNLAFTDRGLALHTDNPYRDPPPSLQLLHCLDAASNGGETILADGVACAARLRAALPDAFALLASTPVRFAWSDAGTALEARAPVIELDAAGHIAGLRVNDRSLAPLDLPQTLRQAWRAAYKALCSVIADEAYQVRLLLAPEDLLIFDNRRILHGRTPFGGGSRWLRGCYADRDGLMSTLAVLMRQEAEARADAALALLASQAGDESYGEGLSLRAHSLQAAAMASADGLPPIQVAGALLHDIGWATGEDSHEASGAALIRELLGEDVARPVLLHVAAKRYLVAIKPGYHAALSPASQATLVRQGGPMTPAEAQAFEQLPGFAAAVALRRIDDCAKDPDAATLPLDAYRSTLTELALRAQYQEISDGL
jgi:gamma-butyrobetaine dioxygenase